MRRWWPWAVAGSVLLAAVALWLADGRPAEPVARPAHPAAQATAGAAMAGTPVMAAAAGTVTPASAPLALTLQTLLLPDRGISARIGTIRLGLALVAAEDARSYQDWIAAGSEGAGPASLAELATVQRWIDLPAQLLADGSVQVGPAPLPAADRYDLQASTDSPLHRYSASFTAERVPQAIPPTLAAGLRILREPDAGHDLRVLLRRSSESTDDGTAAGWQALLAQESPELLGAFDEAAIAVAPVQILAPLPPGLIEVILQVDGVEAQRRTTELVAGSLAEVQFDALAQTVASAVATSLELRFVVEGSERPVAGLQVQWANAREPQIRVSDGHGLVVFKGMDRQQLQHFQLQFPVTDGQELPTWPVSKAIAVTLDDTADATPAAASAPARIIRKTIALRPLQWLQVRMGDFPMPGDRQGGNPYPIFVLQREQNGHWLDTAADRFIAVPDGLAVSIEETGRFRLAALRAPWSILFSSAADTAIAREDGRYPVALQKQAGQRSEVLVLRGGAPLVSTTVDVRAPGHGLPGLSLDTDRRGRLLFDGVTVSELRIEVPGHQVASVDLRSARATVQLQPEP